MLRPLLVVTLCLSALAAQDNAANIAPSAYQNLRYRLIGPFRASRTVAGVGIPTQPSVFFTGVHTGGVWKTDDYGRTWRPIFDSAPTGSIGDIGVSCVEPRHPLRRHRRGAASAGSRRGRRHLQVHRRRQVVEARRPERRPAGRPPGRPPDQSRHRVCRRPRPSVRTERASAASSARSTAARPGRKCCRQREHAAASRSSSIRRIRISSTASIWEHREGPWENASFSGPNSGLYKSTDGGATWTQLKGGLPTGAEGAGRICLGIGTERPEPPLCGCDGAGTRSGGFYRSNDGGQSWTLVSKRQTTRPRRPRAPDESRRRLCRATSPRIDRTTAARRGRRSRARRAATTISGSGSIRCSRTSCSSPPIREPSSRSTAAGRGAPGTTSRRRRCTTSRPTISFPTGSTAGSRRAARSASRAAATAVRSPSATGSASARTSTRTSRRTRWTPTSSLAAA